MAGWENKAVSLDEQPTADSEGWAHKATPLDNIGTPVPSKEVADSAQKSIDFSNSTGFPLMQVMEADTELSTPLSVIEPKHSTARSFASRFSDQLHNTFVGSLVTMTSGRDSSYVEDRAFQLVLKYEKDNGFKFPDALFEDQLADWTQQLMLPSELRESIELKDEPQMVPFKDMDSWLGPRTEMDSTDNKWLDVAIDSAAGLIGFITKTKILGSALNKGNPSTPLPKGVSSPSPIVSTPIIWETVSIANGGKPGEASSLYGALGLFADILPKVPGGAPANKLLSGVSSGTLFGVTTYIAGGSTEEIVLNTSLPIILSAMSITNEDWQKAKPKSKLQIAKELRLQNPELAFESTAKIVKAVGDSLDVKPSKKPLTPKQTAQKVRIKQLESQKKALRDTTRTKGQSPEQLSQNIKTISGINKEIRVIKEGFEPAKPVSVKGKKRKSKVAERVTEDAILNDLLPAETRDKIPTYEVSNQREQIKKGQVMQKTSPDKLMRIAMGEEAPPSDMLATTAYAVAHQRAKKIGDFHTLDRLSNSPHSMALTRAGQEISMARHIGGGEYSATGVMRDVKNARNPISTDMGTQKAEVARAKQSRKQSKVVSKAKKAVDKLDTKIAEKTIDSKISDISTPKIPKGKKVDTKSKSYGKRNRLVTRAEYDKIQLELKAEGGGLKVRVPVKGKHMRKGSAFVPSGKDLKRMSKLATFHLEAIGRDFTAWSNVLRSQLGDWVVPHLQKTWNETIRKIGKADTNLAVSKIANGIKAGKTLDKMGVQIQKMAEGFVAQGVKTRGALINKVHEVLVQVDPHITKRQTMDAISGFGKFKTLSPDQIKTELRDLKGQMQQVAKLEEMQAGRAPSKTGVERRTPSGEERRLIQKVNEAKKKGGFEVTDPDRQLKSSLDTIKTRLKNRINDLETQITTKTKTVKTKTEQPTDAEVVRLTRKRDALQKEFNDIFKKPKMTDAQRVKASLKATEKSIAELEKRKATGDIEPKKKSKGPTSPELETARKKRDALKADIKKMKDAKHPKKTPEQKATEASLKATERSIQELERRIKTGDLHPKKKESKAVETDELKAARSQRDALKEEIKALDLANNPKKTPEEVALQSYKARLKTEKAKLDAKIADGDFVKTAKDPMKLDLEAQTLKHARDKASRTLRIAQEVMDSKNNVSAEELNTITQLSGRIEEKQIQVDNDPLNKSKHIELGKAMLALEDYVVKINPRETTAGTIALDIAGAPTAIMTSIDMSFPFRQGWGSMTTKEFWQGFKEMHKYAWSEANLQTLMAEIKGSPKFAMAKKAGLRISDLKSQLQFREEGMQSTLADKIPVAGRYIRASQRGYTGMANYVRWNRFNNLVDLANLQGLNVSPGSKIARDIANVVNITTGSGNLGVADQFGNTSPVLNQFLFSARKISADVQMINPHQYKQLSPFARKAYIKQVVGSMGTSATILGLAAMAGLEVETDLTSSNAGKVVIGNNHIDITGGKLSLLVAIARYSKEQIKTGEGYIIDFDPEDPFSPTRPKIIHNYIKNKRAPNFALLTDLFVYKENFKGEPIETKEDVTKRVGENFYPINLGDIISIAQDDTFGDVFTEAVFDLFLSTMSTYGNSVSVYDEND